MRKFKAGELKLASIIIAFAAIVMIFLPAVTANITGNSYTGLQVVFGHKTLDFGSSGSGELLFSFMNLIAYSLPLFAALALIFIKKGFIVSTILFAIAVVLFFLVPDFMKVSITIVDEENIISYEWNYAFGLIIAGFLSFLGFIIGAIGIYKKL